MATPLLSTRETTSTSPSSLAISSAAISRRPRPSEPSSRSSPLRRKTAARLRRSVESRRVSPGVVLGAMTIGK